MNNSQQFIFLTWSETVIVYYIFICKTYVGRDSVVGIATRYGLGGPGIGSRWGEIFHTCPDRPWGPPSLLYNGYRVFPRGKAAEAWRWPPTPSSAEVKERVELYLYSPSGPSWPYVKPPPSVKGCHTVEQEVNLPKLSPWKGGQNILS
jgi:hypothetical protein